MGARGSNAAAILALIHLGLTARVAAAWCDGTLKVVPLTSLTSLTPALSQGERGIRHSSFDGHGQLRGAWGRNGERLCIRRAGSSGVRGVGCEEDLLVREARCGAVGLKRCERAFCVCPASPGS